MYTLRELKNMDTIVFDKGARSLTSRRLADSEETRIRFLPVLKEGVIKIEDLSPINRFYVQFHSEDGPEAVTHCECFVYDSSTSKFGFLGTIDMPITYIDKKDPQDVKYTLRNWAKGNTPKLETARVKLVGAIVMRAMVVFGYLSLATQHPIIKSREPKQTARTTGPAASALTTSKRSTININGIRYITDNPERLFHQFKRGIVRHADAWTVRGHYRHLKSGQSVFVRSHVKGDRTKAVSPKTYIVADG